MYPEIHYRKGTDGWILTSCYGYDGVIRIPDEIDGIPITAIAPYAFSEGKEEADEQTWCGQEAIVYEERKRLCTTEVLEIHLPKGIREIGRYAFYRCRNLRKLVLSDGIMEIGGGALNGCRGLREVDIHLWNGEKSALKSIVDEVRFEIYARLFYHVGNEETVAELLFPEHYEEAVENTPARILYTSHHGAGGYYRQCFYNREVDYKKYDELLPWAIAGDSVENVFRMSLLRLAYPHRLSEKAKDAYEKYVRGHMDEIAEVLVKKEDMKNIRFLSTLKCWDKASLDTGIDAASELGKTEILSFLMDEKKKLYPKKRKTFDL